MKKTALDGKSEERQRRARTAEYTPPILIVPSY